MVELFRESKGEIWMTLYWLLLRCFFLTCVHSCATSALLTRAFKKVSVEHSPWQFERTIGEELPAVPAVTDECLLWAATQTDQHAESKEMLTSNRSAPLRAKQRQEMERVNSEKGGKNVTSLRGEAKQQRCEGEGRDSTLLSVLSGEEIKRLFFFFGLRKKEKGRKMEKLKQKRS